MMRRTTELLIDGMTWGELRHFVSISPHLPDSRVAFRYDEEEPGHPIAIAFFEEIETEGGGS